MSQHTLSKVQRLWVWGPETEAGTAQGATAEGQGQRQVATPSRVASVCGCQRCRCSWSCIRGIIYAFKQSKAPRTSRQLRRAGVEVGWGWSRGWGCCVVPGAGNANYVMCQVTGKFILIAVEMQYCIYTHTHTHVQLPRQWGAWHGTLDCIRAAWGANKLLMGVFSPRPFYAHCVVLETA